MEAFVLLGSESNGMFDEFGGGRDRGEKDPRNTAAREFEEESCGVFCSAEEIKPLLFDYNRSDNPPGSALVFSASYLEFWVRVK